MDTIKILPTANPYRYDIAIRQFQITADEPTHLGGTDTGATPTELVFAGLGSCKAITLQMYAALLDWGGVLEKQVPSGPFLVSRTGAVG